MEIKLPPSIGKYFWIIIFMIVFVIGFIFQFWQGGLKKIEMCTSEIVDVDTCATNEVVVYGGYIPAWLCEALGNKAIWDNGLGFAPSRGYIGCSPK